MASSPGEVEARSLASVVDGFLGTIVFLRMFVLLVVVRGLFIQKDFVGHLFCVMCVHLLFVVLRLTLMYVLLDILDFVVMLSV
jgi:hypothetical protein